MEEPEILNGCLTEPFRCVISGSSGVGKGKLVEQLLINKNGLYPREFEKIIYCYGVKTTSLDILKDYFQDKIQFYCEIPDQMIELCSKRKRDKICVLEDLMKLSSNQN